MTGYLVSGAIRDSTQTFLSVQLKQVHAQIYHIHFLGLRAKIRDPGRAFHNPSLALAESGYVDKLATKSEVAACSLPMIYRKE